MRSIIRFRMILMNINESKYIYIRLFPKLETYFYTCIDYTAQHNAQRLTQTLFTVVHIHSINECTRDTNISVNQQSRTAHSPNTRVHHVVKYFINTANRNPLGSLPYKRSHRRACVSACLPARNASHVHVNDVCACLSMIYTTYSSNIMHTYVHTNVPKSHSIYMYTHFVCQLCKTW